MWWWNWLPGIDQVTICDLGSMQLYIEDSMSPGEKSARNVRSTRSSPKGLTSLPSVTCQPRSDRKNTNRPTWTIDPAEMQPTLLEITLNWKMVSSKLGAIRRM